MEWLLFRQCDVLSARQARGFFTESALRHRVASGRWQRPHRSAYVVNNGPISRDQELWIAVFATGGVLAGGTALGEYGLHRYRGYGIHVLLPARRQVRDVPRGVFVRRSSVLPRSHIHWTADPPRTLPARTVVDAAQWAPSDDEACAVVAAAFQRRLVGASDVESVLAVLPRARRRALIRSAVADAAGGTHSLAELDYLRLNRRYGLPEPVRQARRTDAGGRVRYLDIYYSP